MSPPVGLGPADGPDYALAIASVVLGAAWLAGAVYVARTLARRGGRSPLVATLLALALNWMGVLIVAWLSRNPARRR